MLEWFGGNEEREGFVLMFGLLLNCCNEPSREEKREKEKCGEWGLSYVDSTLSTRNEANFGKNGVKDYPFMIYHFFWPKFIIGI